MRTALLRGRRLLLVHEEDEARSGVPRFGQLLRVTPPDLLALQIYADVAIPMKAEPFRSVSVGLLGLAISAPPCGSELKQRVARFLPRLPTLRDTCGKKRRRSAAVRGLPSGRSPLELSSTPM